MISTYSDYILQYIFKTRSRTYPSPGEHHFVAAYLVPRLIEKLKLVPDYINPDGTKLVCGDVVYYRNESHHFGIEVKSDVVRLTRWEFNSWIVDTENSLWPDIFVGICSTGIICCTWHQFRDAYIAAVRRSKKQDAWKPCEIPNSYGPTTQVKFLIKNWEPGANWFPVQEAFLAKEWGKKFLACLAEHTKKVMISDPISP